MSSAVGDDLVVHYREELRALIEAARAYQPSVAIVELSDDVELTRVLVDEITAVSPDTRVIGMFSIDGMVGGEAESTRMLQALRLGVEDFIRRPISSDDLRQLLRRRLQPRRARAAAVGMVISFVSNKGGVGKSTAAVNVATELARRNPGKVLLIDGSLQMGVCADQLNVTPKATLTDAWQQRERLDERLLRELTTAHDSGLHLLAAPSDAMEASELDDAIVSRLILLARRCYDYVIIDTFPLFDRVSMAILDLSDFAFVVVENVVPTLRTVRGFFELLDEVGFDRQRQRVLLNRYSRGGSSPDRHAVEQYLQRDVDHVIPFDKRVITAANTGQPFVLSLNRFSASRRAMGEIVNQIERLRQSDTEGGQRKPSPNGATGGFDQPQRNESEGGE